MADCINLAKRFADSFRIVFDLAHRPRGRCRRNPDPWYMLIPCQRGHIYPHGDQMLGFASDSRGPLVKKLMCSGLVKVIQDGDDGVNVIFHVDDFGAVAAFVKPKRCRRLAREYRTELIESGKRFRFSHGAQRPHSERQWPLKSQRVSEVA